MEPCTRVQHAELDRERTWSDETTHAIHESQTLRIERVHETQARETAWTVAAYETPVSDRMWHLTATSATPAPVLQNLLNHLADGDGWDTVIGVPVGERTVTTATQPLTEAGWKHTLTGHGGTRQPQPGRDHRTRLAASAPATPAVTAGRPASRSR
ncbi:hypothetical protein STENM36S_08589 [Streptomyces tendae]